MHWPSRGKKIASKNLRESVSEDVSDIVKDTPCVGYRDKDGYLVLPADMDDAEDDGLY